MKNRIISVLLLLLATALVSIPYVVPAMGQEDIIETDVAAQKEISTVIEQKLNTEIVEEKEWFEGWTTNVVNVREEPSETSSIVMLLEECTFVRYYIIDDIWVAFEITNNNQNTPLSQLLLKHRSQYLKTTIPPPPPSTLSSVWFPKAPHCDL